MNYIMNTKPTRVVGFFDKNYDLEIGKTYSVYIRVTIEDKDGSIKLLPSNSEGAFAVADEKGIIDPVENKLSNATSNTGNPDTVNNNSNSNDNIVPVTKSDSSNHTPRPISIPSNPQGLNSGVRSSELTNNNAMDLHNPNNTYTRAVSNNQIVLKKKDNNKQPTNDLNKHVDAFIDKFPADKRETAETLYNAIDIIKLDIPNTTIANYDFVFMENNFDQITRVYSDMVILLDNKTTGNKRNNKRLLDILYGWIQYIRKLKIEINTAYKNFKEITTAQATKTMGFINNVYSGYRQIRIAFLDYIMDGHFDIDNIATAP